MKRIKRLGVSITGWVDEVLSQIENHEALAESAVKRVRESTARARAQLRRVERDHARLKSEAEQASRDVAAWKGRALSAKDEDRAIECLRRSKEAERRASSLELRLAEHSRCKQELQTAIRGLDEQLHALVERKNLMRARQSRAEAMHGMVEASGPVGDLDSLFERWDVRVSEIELSADCSDPKDSFEAEYESAEERAQLRDELEALKGVK